MFLIPTTRTVLPLLCSLYAWNTALARDVKEILQTGTINVATEGAFPPFNFVKDSKISGFEVDLVDAMAKTLKISAQFKTLGFDGLLIGLNQGKYDLVAASHAITPERAKVVDFLPPHYCSGAVLVSLKEKKFGMKDLAGKTVATQVSSIYPKWIETHLPSAKLKVFPSETDAIQALSAGKVDAAITERFLAKQFAKTHPEVHLGERVHEERNAMAVRKGNTELRERLTTALQKVVQDGTYRELSLKYFGEDIRCIPSTPDIKQDMK
jgi:polar amino acid transport system substrate-binding protein